MSEPDTELIVVEVWDAPTRWFHWINAGSVLVLAGLGTVILSGGALGLSTEGKVLLKTLHVWVGYLFLANLLWRFVWAFFGNRYARWSAILPGGHGYAGALRRYVSAFLTGHPQSYQGHNPLGRIAITVLLLALLTQGLTGLVLAGTDLYYPPFGHAIAEWVAAPGVDPATLEPYRPALVSETAYEAMRELRSPFIFTHEWLFYVLLALIGMHVLAVVVTEVREGGALISAMFTGRKVLSRRAVDAPPQKPVDGAAGTVNDSAGAASKSADES